MRGTITWRGVLGGLLALVVAVVCVRLGFWQLQRLEQRRTMNAAYAGALELPPLELAGDSLRVVSSRPSAYAYRRAVVVGDPARDRQTIWRGRSFGGRPGVNILTPYLAGSGTAVLVNRGWAPSPDAAHVGPEALELPAISRVEGVLIPFPDAAGRAQAAELEIDGARVLSLQVPDSAVLAERLGRSLLPLYVQRLPAHGDAGAVTPLPLPDLADEGPHLGYAIQWFGFAAIAIIGFVSVLLLRLRRAPR